MSKDNPRCPPDPVEIQMLIARWKAVTGKPQYEIAKKVGIRPDFLSQIAHGTRPGYDYFLRIRQIAEGLAS